MSDPQTPFTVRAKAPYTARNDTEVSLVVGETYQVLQTDGKGLWWQTKGGQGNIGWFPASYTDVIENSPPVQNTPPPQPRPSPQPTPQQSSPQPQVTNEGSGMSVKTTSIQRQGNDNSDREAVPPPSKAARIEDDPSTAYVVIQVVEGRDMKKIDGNPTKTNPFCGIFRRDVMDRDPKGECVFRTTPCKKTITPKWNERFQINVFDAETDIIVLRFASNSKASLKATRNSKTFMGEVSFPLRSSARDFDRPNYQFKWYQLTESSGGGAGTLGEVKIYIEFIDTKQVSGPTDFKQVSHIGWSEDGGFDINNIPPEWKKIFKTVGISKKRLEENPELATQILDIMNTAEDEAAGTAPPPPPPQPSISNNVPTAPKISGNAPPPPPPPPSPGLAKPPTGGLQSQLGSVQLNSTPTQTAPSPPPNGRMSLLDQIAQGKALKKVDVNDHSHDTAPPASGGSLLDTLAAALASNRTAIGGGDDGDDWSDADDWSESD